MRELHQTPQPSKTIQIIIKMGQSRIRYRIPRYWSINKIKCLLSMEIDTLHFDQFEMVCREDVVLGGEKLGDIVARYGDEEQVEMEIVKSQSKIRLKEYYKQVMGNFIKLSNECTHPIYHPSYQIAKNFQYAWLPLLKKGNINNFLNENPGQQFPQVFNQLNPILGLMPIINIISIYVVLILIYDCGSIYQLFTLMWIIGTVYWIERWVKMRLYKIKLREKMRDIIYRNFPYIKKQEVVSRKPNKYLGFCLLYLFKWMEMVFCFLWMVIPNFTMEMYLEINKERIQKGRKIVNLFIPGFYQRKERNKINGD